MRISRHSLNSLSVRPCGHRRSSTYRSSSVRSKITCQCFCNQRLSAASGSLPDEGTRKAFAFSLACASVKAMSGAESSLLIQATNGTHYGNNQVRDKAWLHWHLGDLDWKAAMLKQDGGSATLTFKWEVKLDLFRALRSGKLGPTKRGALKKRIFTYAKPSGQGFRASLRNPEDSFDLGACRLASGSACYSLHTSPNQHVRRFRKKTTRSVSSKPRAQCNA